MHEHTVNGLVQLRARISDAVLVLHVIAAAPSTETAVLSALVGVEPALMALREQVNGIMPPAKKLHCERSAR